MKFRATLAGWLTVMMLSLSFAASACETRCDLNSVGPSCHESSRPAATLQNQPMTAMAGIDSQAMPETNAAAAEPTALMASQTCLPHLCVQEPVVLGNENAAVAHAAPQFEVATFIAAAATATSMTAAPGGWLSVRGSPHLQSSSPIALHTTLRI